MPDGELKSEYDCILELEKLVRPYAQRDQNYGDSEFGKRMSVYADASRERWSALTPTDQAGIVAAESEIAERRERAKERERVSELRSKRARRLNESGIRLRDADFEAVLAGKLADTPALGAASEWFNDRGEHAWLVLSGGTGAGKTLATASLIAELAGDSVYLRADMACKIWGAAFGNQFELQSQARDADLLVLDDLGAEEDPARMQRVLLDLFDARASARSFPIVVTTNLKRGELKSRYANERLHSRLTAAKWVGLTGEDLRRTGAK